MRAVLVLAALLWTVPGTASAAELGLVQETSLGFQLQTVQAANYSGTYQTSLGARWTLGLDWDRWIVLRAGLTARAVQTSPIILNTVYPGYQGSGWTAAVDWLPLKAPWLGASWAAGLSAAVQREFFTYPGLYRDFVLPGATAALLGEVVPGGTSGLAFRLAVPVGVDQRDSFWLSWRMGVELGVVFRGVGWTVP